MKLGKVILFAGTTEGRLIGEALVSHDNVEIHVATEYGKDLLPESNENYHVFEGRLDKLQMMEIMTNGKNDSSDERPLVIDATHPYAVEVTENIQKAAKASGAEYYRVIRGEDENLDWSEVFKDRIIYCDSIDEAAEILGRLGEKALITTGSKDILPFTKVSGYRDLFTLRILPLEGAFRAAIDAGFQGKNLVAMQGPFSVEMNRALIKMTGAKVLVTKESGQQGGFLEKLIASRDENIKVVVIRRPRDEIGYSVAEILDILEKKGVKVNGSGSSMENSNDATGSLNARVSSKAGKGKRWFPIFMDSKGKKALIIGGGTIGERRVETLLKFQWQVTVLAKSFSEKIRKLEEQGLVQVEPLELVKEQLSNLDWSEYHMVIGATDDNKLNKEIYKKAVALGKWANDASCKENCNFYFPAVSARDNVTVAINGQGKNHKQVRRVRENIDKLLERFVNENSDKLGK